jgi:hypothetical protein
VEPAGLDPLGAVKSGGLTLIAIIRQGIWTWRESQEGQGRRKFFLLNADGKVDEKTTYFYFSDTSNFPNNIPKLWFLNITSRVGLALLPKSS